MIHVCMFRLKLMYRGIPVRLLSLLVILVTMVLLGGLYGGGGDASKLKIGLYYEAPSELTETITATLKANEILLPREYSYDDGIRAVRESRIEALFVFKEALPEKIEEEDFNDLVDVYFLDENYLPYLLTDIVGSALIGEIAVSTALHYFEGALLTVGRNEAEDQGYMSMLHDRGMADIHVEKDNFFIDKTYINEADIKVDDVVLDNELLFRQVIYGVVYIFAAFYWMFLGVGIVRDRENGLGKRWFTTGMAQWRVYIGEALSLWVGGLPIILSITVMEVWFDGHLLYYLTLNLTYAMAYAAFVYMLTNLMDKVTVYVLGVTGIILVGGIISGSFFALDTSSLVMTGISLLTPTYPLLTGLSNLAVLDLSLPEADYYLYMVRYTVAALAIGAAIRYLRWRWVRE